MQPLYGLKLLDLTWHVAGPYCTKLLGDFGAEIIKVERPGTGDPARTYGPFPGDLPDSERSGTFLHLNTNKKSITVNLKTEAGKDIIRDLVRDADVVVESFSPGVLSRLELDYAALSEINPGLVMCSISNFGQTGPYRDWKATNIVLDAMGGLMTCTGEEGYEPLKSVDHGLEYLAGTTGTTAIMGAVLHKRWNGEGQYIDVSAHEVAAGYPDRRMTALTGYEYTGRISTREPMLPTALPYGCFPCADGYVSYTVQPPARWTRFMEMMGRPDLLEDERFKDPGVWSDPATKEEMDAMWFPWLMEHTKQEARDEGQHSRRACAAVNSTAEVLGDRHLAARGFWRKAGHPEAGELTYTGPSFHMGEGAWTLRSTAPLLGQHNTEVFTGRLGLSPQEIGVLRSGDAV
jgi:crotonobetainyl-CoA:carnitine CoA-transferase CaiB-like acyl-CoA transferase